MKEQQLYRAPDCEKFELRLESVADDYTFNYKINELLILVGSF